MSHPQNSARPQLYLIGLIAHPSSSIRGNRSPTVARTLRDIADRRGADAIRRHTGFGQGSVARIKAQFEGAKTLRGIMRIRAGHTALHGQVNDAEGTAVESRSTGFNPKSFAGALAVKLLKKNSVPGKFADDSKMSADPTAMHVTEPVSIEVYKRFQTFQRRLLEAPAVPYSWRPTALAQKNGTHNCVTYAAEKLEEFISSERARPDLGQSDMAALDRLQIVVENVRVEACRQIRKGHGIQGKISEKVITGNLLLASGESAGMPNPDRCAPFKDQAPGCGLPSSASARLSPYQPRDVRRSSDKDHRQDKLKISRGV